MSQFKPRFSSLQQTIEAMTLIYDAKACPGLQASIQFEVSGAEAGEYYLHISGDDCLFHKGSLQKPTVCIHTPSHVWMQIVNGQLSGEEALMNGLYTASGDFSLLQKWSTLFKRNGDNRMQAPPEQRPAGPLAWKGSTWMAAAFLPWILHWITFGVDGVPLTVSVGLPFLVSACIVFYRLRYNRPDWLELGGLAFFSAGIVMSLLHISVFATWGSVWSNLVMGILWMVSLIGGEEPLSMQYVKWNFDRRLWRFSLFPYINAAVSLVWGFQCLLAALLGGIALVMPQMNLLFTILRYLTLIPAYWFTSWYPKAGMQNPVKDTSRSQNRLRLISMAGVAFCLLLFAVSLFV